MLQNPLSVSSASQLSSAVSSHHKAFSKAAIAVLTIRALGVIYGDIGTSPLYVLNSMFTNLDTVEKEDALGACSMIIWLLIMVVTIKYVILVLRIDNNGEGGIFALLSLIPPASSRFHVVFVALTIIGSSFVIGDGIITPAISVLSAIEGIQVGVPGFAANEVPITIAILFVLFMCQRFGTNKIGGSFGPIMVLWFLAIGLIGLVQIVQAPAILAAFSPSYGLAYLFSGRGGLQFLGTGVLCVTGVEALYADLGHFGRLPIRLSWLCIVLPGLLLNYLGQGAFLLNNPTNFDELFFLIVPTPLLWPMIILSTVATVIASQAMISGVFSLISQSVSFQFFPSVQIIHTSENLIGQIYVPLMNWVMMVLTLVVVGAFQTSANLSQAYGVAVTGVMFMTSILFVAACHLRLHTAPWKLAIYAVVFWTIDLALFASCVDKFVSGGWLPVVVGIFFAAIMWIWRLGRIQMEEYIRHNDVSEDKLKYLLEHYNVTRTPNTGVFLTSMYDVTPQSLNVLLPRMRSIPMNTIFLTIKFMPIPVVPEAERVTLTGVFGLEGITHITIAYGFAEVPHVADLVKRIIEHQQLGQSSPTNTITQSSSKLEASAGIDLTTVKVDDGSDLDGLHVGQITFYLSRERIRTDKSKWPGHRLWVKFFKVLLNNSRSKAEVFKLPANETVEVGCFVVL